MPLFEIEKRLTTILAWGTLTVTLLVTDRFSVDPANIGKMVALASTAGFCLSMLYSGRSLLFEYFKAPLILLTGFLIFSLISIFVSKSPWEKGFYGTFGRNTGFITYLSASILFIAATQLYRKKSYLRMLRILFVAGVFNIIYCLLAINGIDLFTWENPYGKVLGTFGNPNFISSFLGIFIAATFTLTISSLLTGYQKVIGLTLILTSLFIISKSGSQQGGIVAAGGVAIVIFFYLRNRFEKQVISFLYVLGFFAIALTSVLGMLRIGPLSGLLYKDSVSYRGEYWQAGLNMAFGNPLFGVGLDSYGTFYRAYRSESSTITPGMDTVSDAAHNIFIDILSGSGFIGFFIYLGLLAIVLIEAMKFIKKNRNFDPIFVSLFATWMAYLAQSIISINQIGVAVWGWIIGGLLFGYCRKFNLGMLEIDKEALSLFTENKKKIESKEIPAGVALGSFIGGLIFFLASSPSLYADAVLRQAMTVGSAERLYLAAKTFPLDANRLNYVASKISRDGISEQTVELIDLGLRKFPNDYGLLYSQFQISVPGSEEQKAIGKRLHLADPYNPAYFKFK